MSIVDKIYHFFREKEKAPRDAGRNLLNYLKRGAKLLHACLEFFKFWFCVTPCGFICFLEGFVGTYWRASPPVPFEQVETSSEVIKHPQRYTANFDIVPLASTFTIFPWKPQLLCFFIPDSSFCHERLQIFLPHSGRFNWTAQYHII